MKRQAVLATMTAVGMLMAPAAALAQAQTDTRTQTETNGAFSGLSPGGQKITRALHDAQTQPAADESATAEPGVSDAMSPRTLDEIAAAKASGQGWGQVFKEMKAEGLIEEKNLGQVISKANHAARAPDGGGTAAGAVSSSGAAAGSRRPVTITLGNGQTVSVGAHGGRGGGVSAGHTAAKPNRGRDPGGGIVNAGGAAAAGPGVNRGKGNGGNVHVNHGSGHGGGASAGIVSAAGGAGAGAQAGMTHGNGNAGGNGGGHGHGRGK